MCTTSLVLMTHIPRNVQRFNCQDITAERGARVMMTTVQSRTYSHLGAIQNERSYCGAVLYFTRQQSLSAGHEVIGSRAG